MNAKLMKAIGTLVGLTIGAGVLGIPYVVAHAGFLTGIFVIVFIGLIILLMNLYVGEITLRTKGVHQLPGYVEKYLGKTGKFFMSLAMMVIGYGAMTAYLIGEGEAWHAMLGVSALYPMLIFFAIMAFAVHKGLKLIETLEVCLNCAVVGSILLIVLLAVGAVDPSNYTGFDVTKILIPYGVVFFAFVGSAAIPDLRVELVKQRKLMKKAIIIGSLIPLLLYLLFAFVVVGVTGMDSTPVATVGLGESIGGHMVLLGNFFAAFSMATSFLVLALALLWMYHYDYKMNKWLALLLTLIIPLIIALSGVTSFIQVLAVTGSLAGGLEGILIILTHRAAQRNSERKPEYTIRNPVLLSCALVLVYVIGVLYTIFTVF